MDGGVNERTYFSSATSTFELAALGKNVRFLVLMGTCIMVHVRHLGMTPGS